MKTLLTAPLLENTKFSDQLATETQAVDEGVRRYREQSQATISRGDAASLKPVERLAAHWFETTSVLIKDEQADSAKGVPGRNRTITGPLIRQVHADNLAVIVMHEALGMCMSTEDIFYDMNKKPVAGVEYARLAYAVGRAAVAHIHLQLGRKTHKESVKELEFSARKLSVGRVNWWANRTLEDPYSERKALSMLGDVLLTCLIDAASCSSYGDTFEPAFVHHVAKMGRKDVGFVAMTEAAWKIVEDGFSLRERMRPVYLPMVVEPLAWQEKNKDRARSEGGYIRIRTPLISKPTRSQKEALDTADLSTVFEMVNAIGAPAMAINLQVLAVQKEMYKQGGGELGLPSLRNEEPLTKPDDFDNWTKDRKDKWNKDASNVYRRNVHARGFRKLFNSMHAVADQFSEHDAIYFPHQLCFRGRGYPIPPALNHQGADPSIGLLRFSRSLEPSMRELFIHAANCYGQDKLSPDDREQWGRDHAKQILQAALDPLNDEWWQRADESRPGAHDGKPWQFLAACMAIANPEEHGSRLPVSADGTCNGLQHYAAMTRDADIAAWVNMMPSGPSDAPRNFYRHVAEVTAAKVRADMDKHGETMKYRTADGERVRTIAEIAGLALPYAIRPVVKQPTMTKLYNVTPTGARKQIRGVLVDRGVKEDDRYPISKYLAGVVLDTVKELCPAADHAMDWIKTCARMICERNRPVTWTTPIGLPVVQPYRCESSVTVRTIAQSLKLAVTDETLPVKMRRQVDGSAPNFVHGVDASHMGFTAIRCRKNDVDFLATHDRYFSHSATKEVVGRFNRQEFCILHRDSLLDRLRDQWQRLHPDIDLPPTPEKGTFDITNVLKAAGFFN